MLLDRISVSLPYFRILAPLLQALCEGVYRGVGAELGRKVLSLRFWGGLG